MSEADRYREDNEQLDIGELLSVLWQGRWVLFSSVAVFAGAFVAVAFLMTPVYTAFTVLVPASSERAGSLGSALGPLGGLASIAGINVSSGDTQTQEALAVLRSREFTEEFITDHGLMTELYAPQWDARAAKWKGDARNQPTLVRAYKYFDELRTVTEDKKTGLIKVQIAWRDPDQAALWVNELIERLNSVMRARAIKRTDALISYLQQELATTSTVETRNAIGRIMETRINERMLANVSTEFAFRVVDTALPPDLRDPTKPNKPLLILSGILTGIVVGTVGVFLRATLRKKARATVRFQGI